MDAMSTRNTMRIFLTVLGDDPRALNDKLASSSVRYIKVHYVPYHGLVNVGTSAFDMIHSRMPSGCPTARSALTLFAPHMGRGGVGFPGAELHAYVLQLPVLAHGAWTCQPATHSTFLPNHAPFPPIVGGRSTVFNFNDSKCGNYECGSSINVQ